MNPERDAILKWFFNATSARLAEVFEAMTGQRPATATEPLAAPDKGGLSWRQSFEGAPGAIWTAAGKPDWIAGGNQVLVAAGMEDNDEDLLKSTYLETLGQALSGVAQALTARLGNDVTCGRGEEAPAVQANAGWAKISLTFESAKCDIAVGVEDDLVQAVFDHEKPKDIPPPAPAAPDPSKTFDLLMDVELPVSVSFGRAQVLLKEVLKLTTGSIVELNRAITEPVEVIVNNCVIARGEVVVVEGNFGVRIQQVISRQERLRTLN